MTMAADREPLVLEENLTGSSGRPALGWGWTVWSPAPPPPLSPPPSWWFDGTPVDLGWLAWLSPLTGATNSSHSYGPNVLMIPTVDTTRRE